MSNGAGIPGRTPRPQYRRLDIGHLVLGRRLRNDEDLQNRLSNPEALPVFASDALSSVAYATEEMLRVLVPVAGLAAYGAVVPMSGVIVALLAVLVLSYRQTIRAYPSAGGAYVVTRDNFGPNIAQVAGVALLTDYVLTVAVSVVAGVAATTSMIPTMAPWRLPLVVALIWGIALANLRGLRQSARLFAIPAYSFVASVLFLVVAGAFTDPAPHIAAPQPNVAAGSLGLVLLLRAFAAGCTAMTGVEAISNGVSAFRPDEARNARRVLVWLGSTLAVMFLGISILASRMHPAISSTETMLSQLGRDIFGTHGLGNGAFVWLQVSTAAILVLAANTSFADFPRLMSFQAHDHYMPAALGRKGRRLVFSDGMVILAAVATGLVVMTGAQLTRLIPLYAIGVFLSFTMSQIGMTRHHLTRREHRWRRGILINGTGAAATGLVLIVITATKLTAGAWIVLVVLPVMVTAIEAGNRHYRRVTATPPTMTPSAPIQWRARPATEPGTEPAASAAMRWIEDTMVRDLPASARAIDVFVGPGKRRRSQAPPDAGIEVAVPDGWGRGEASVVIAMVGSSADVGSAVVRRAGQLFRPEVRAVHVVDDQALAAELVADWPADLAELECVDAPTRTVPDPTIALVSRLAGEGLNVTVVVGHVRSPWRYRALHNHHGRALRSALEDDGRAAVVTISYRLGYGNRRESGDRAPSRTDSSPGRDTKHSRLDEERDGRCVPARPGFH